MGGAMGLILSCEHASCLVPPGVSLGVSQTLIASHIGWDPGAIDVATALALGWGVPLFAGQVSRLVVDLNRSPDNPDVIPELAFGEPVKGNLDLREEDRAARMRAFHDPFRRAMVAEIGARQPCRHLSIHSFAPTLHGRSRRFDIGLLYDPARRSEVAWVSRLMSLIRAVGLDVRLNQPYAGTEDGMTTWLRTRFPDSVYAGVELEISHRLTDEQRERLIDGLLAFPESA